LRVYFEKIFPMMKSILFLFLFSTGILSGQDFFEKSDRFFSKYVSEGYVDYSGISKDPKELEELVKMIEDYSFVSSDQDEILAFYCNAYNLLVIKGVIDIYPAKSPMDKAGFFENRKWKVSGEIISLNELENNKVRPLKDPRIHFALVCAAKGCPKISDQAFLPSRISRQLEERTRASLNDPYFIRYDEGKGRVEVSQIFNWYGEDFGGKDKIIPFLNRYRELKIPDTNHLEFYEYDWALNGKK
jgi:Protein of unknown function, DUF547